MKSKYKGVEYHTWRGQGRPHVYWRARKSVCGQCIVNKCFPFTEDGERDAAKAVDLALIRNGLPPINILVKA